MARETKYKSQSMSRHCVRQKGSKAAAPILIRVPKHAKAKKPKTSKPIREE
jgi:hypothetical protein